MSWGTTSRVPISLPNLPTTAAVAFSNEEAALSISDQRTLYLVNIFFADTACFLNKFSAICEEKLADCQRRMLRLNATLTLLEAKLKSIDDVWELEKCSDFDIGRSSNQALLQNSSNILNSTVASGSGDPSSSSVSIQNDIVLASE